MADDIGSLTTRIQYMGPAEWKGRNDSSDCYSLTSMCTCTHNKEVNVIVDNTQMMVNVPK